MGALFGFIGQIPFIGKHKTILGSVMMAVNAVDKLTGLNVIPDIIGDLGQGWTGLGLADKARKNRRGTLT